MSMLLTLVKTFLVVTIFNLNYFAAFYNYNKKTF